MASRDPIHTQPHQSDAGAFQIRNQRNDVKTQMERNTFNFVA